MTTAKYEDYVSRYSLRRFVDAHRNMYASALKEIKSGEKNQVRGKTVSLDVVHIPAAAGTWP